MNPGLITTIVRYINKVIKYFLLIPTARGAYQLAIYIAWPMIWIWDHFDWNPSLYLERSLEPCTAGLHVCASNNLAVPPP